MSIPVDKDLVRLREEETKPKKNTPQIYMKKPRIFNEVPIDETIQIKDDLTKENRLESNDEEHKLIFHLKTDQVFKLLPRYFHIQKENLGIFTLTINTEVGKIICNCEKTGGHKKKDDEKWTYYELERPTIEFKIGNVKETVRTIYNKWTQLQKNKDDLKHFYEINSKFNIEIWDRILPSYYEGAERLVELPVIGEDGNVVFTKEGNFATYLDIVNYRNVTQQQGIIFGITDNEKVYDIDEYKYEEKITDGKMKDFMKYVTLKRGCKEGTPISTNIESYGIQIFLEKEKGNPIVDVQLVIKITREYDYKYIKGILNRKRITSIELEMGIRNEPEKYIEKSKDDVSGMIGEIPIGMPIEGLPFQSTIPMNYGQQIPIEQQPIIQVIESQRVIEQPIEGIIPNISVEPQPVVRMEEETITNNTSIPQPITTTIPKTVPEGLSLTDFLENF